MKEPLRDVSIRRAIKNIALRAERQDTDTIKRSFFDWNLTTHLENRNHQIVQGRRGTGKTHILRVLEQSMETDGQHCIYFDCHETGNITSVSNRELTEEYRAVLVIREFINKIFNDLNEYYRLELESGQFGWQGREVRELIDRLIVEQDNIGIIPETRSLSQNNNSNWVDEKSFTGEGVFAKVRSLSATVAKRSENGGERNKVYSETGKLYFSVVCANVNHCLRRLAEITQKSFVILIDEWSGLSLDIQPHFAEFIRRSLLITSKITVKIAAIDGRTRFSIRKNCGDMEIYGLEIGADISLSLDLDALYMYDKKPKMILGALYSILWVQLKAEGVIKPEYNLKTFFTQMFTKPDLCMKLLARASEGNPREFISILALCMEIIERDNAYLIDDDTIYEAAEFWYKEDKIKELTVLQKSALGELITYVVQNKSSRGFIIDEKYMNHPNLRALIDARVVHVLKSDMMLSNLGRNLMAILVLDFGTYAHNVRTGDSVHFVVEEGEQYEEIIFSRYEFNRYADDLMWLDKKTKIRKCLVDPEYLPDLFPSLQWDVA